MARVTGLDFVALQVSDMERSKDFYTRILGLKVAPQAPPHATVFATEPIPFAIREPNVDLSAANKLGWGVAPWFACDDIGALHARVVDAGVTVLAPPAEGPFGRFFIIADPDGYTLTIHQGGR
jgi:predicted enzyme related to lactoylglutathione lyase